MTNYRCETERLDDRTQRARVTSDGAGLTVRAVVTGWTVDVAMADVFTRLIARCPCDAIYWEMPPLTHDNLDDEFECVLIDSPALARLSCDPGPFDEHFAGDADVAVFPNLGGDALLVVPAPVPADAQYTHLAAFCRTAPQAPCRRFWQCLGQAIADRIGDKPTWISTAGLGVGWLHARLDRHPKYYSHGPYRIWPENRGDADA